MANETITLKHEGAYEPTGAQLKRIPKDRIVSSTTEVGVATTYELKPKTDEPKKADEKPTEASPSASKG